MTLYYPERIILFDLTHKMSMAYHTAIDVKILRIDNGRFDTR